MPTFIAWQVEEEGKISGREMRRKMKDYKWIFSILEWKFDYFILMMIKMMIPSNGDDYNLQRTFITIIIFKPLNNLELSQLISFYMDEEMRPNELLDLHKS